MNICTMVFPITFVFSALTSSVIIKIGSKFPWNLCVVYSTLCFLLKQNKIYLFAYVWIHSSLTEVTYFNNFLITFSRLIIQNIVTIIVIECRRHNDFIVITTIIVSSSLTLLLELLRLLFYFFKYNWQSIIYKGIPQRVFLVTQIGIIQSSVKDSLYESALNITTELQLKETISVASAEHCIALP